MSIRPLLAFALVACAESPTPTVVTPQPVAPLQVGTGDVAHAPTKPKSSDGTDPLDDAKPLEGENIVGQRAPGFKGKTPGGKEVTPYKDRVTVIHFWATWCGPCKHSMPALEKMYEKNHDNGLDVIGLSVDDEVDGVAEFASDMKVKYPVVYDGGHTIAKNYNVASMPSTYVIDRKGTIRFVHQGYHDGEVEELTKEVESLF